MVSDIFQACMEIHDEEAPHSAFTDWMYSVFYAAGYCAEDRSEGRVWGTVGLQVFDESDGLCGLVRVLSNWGYGPVGKKEGMMWYAILKLVNFPDLSGSTGRG